MRQTTTHLICAPSLSAPATVSGIHVTPGLAVGHDALLVSLQAGDEHITVHAPSAGIVASLMVAVNDAIASDELLLMMEIEEEESDWLAMVDDLPPACTAAGTPAVAAPQDDLLRISRGAAALAARLGVDLSQVSPGPDGVIDEAAVERWVRQALGR